MEPGVSQLMLLLRAAEQLHNRLDDDLERFRLQDCDLSDDEIAAGRKQLTRSYVAYDLQ